ncbi:restriction endonuclease subunit S [Corynebacterium casei]|uniref:restriction endonuclease subunit S n=1 Tax=Corynebacterium casei TaxID=160386 RepID=UPI003FD11FA8
MTENWGQVPFHTLFRRIPKRTGYGDKELLSVYRDYGVIIKSDRDDNSNRPGESLDDYQLVKLGDLVLNKMKTWQGSLGISAYEGIVSPAYFVYEPQGEFDSRYMHYLLRSQPSIDYYGAHSKGIRVNQWDLQPEYLDKMKVRFPPLEYQQRIADYLDRETSEIDAAVADLDRYVELLDKRRRVMIAQLVTRGIGSDCFGFYHPSGMSELSPRDKHRLYPWLSFSNPDWEEVRFDSFLRLKKQTVGDKWSTTPLLSLTRRGVVLRDITNNEGKIPASFADYQTVAPGDLVLCLFDLDETPRTVGLSPLAGMITSAYTVFEIDETVVDPLFLEFFLIHIDNGKMFKPIYSGLRKVVRKDALGQVLMKLPPLETQIQIASNLQDETAEIDSLIAKSTRLRDLLLKRRSVLITEVVTGRKQV